VRVHARYRLVNPGLYVGRYELGHVGRLMVLVHWKMLVLRMEVLVRLQEFCHRQSHSLMLVLLLELWEPLWLLLVPRLPLLLELRTK
jgi:hypothetical protein